MEGGSWDGACGLSTVWAVVLIYAFVARFAGIPKISIWATNIEADVGQSTSSSVAVRVWSKDSCLSDCLADVM